MGLRLQGSGLGVYLGFQGHPRALKKFGPILRNVSFGGYKFRVWGLGVLTPNPKA